MDDEQEITESLKKHLIHKESLDQLIKAIRTLSAKLRVEDDQMYLTYLLADFLKPTLALQTLISTLPQVRDSVKCQMLDALELGLKNLENQINDPIDELTKLPPINPKSNSDLN